MTTTWRWDTSGLPEWVLSHPATMAFCPWCFAAVPAPLVAMHVVRIHPNARDEAPPDEQR